MIADAAFMIVLALSALLAVILTRGARPASRSYLQFAAVIYLSLAVGDGVAIVFPTLTTFADSITLVACALAPVSLALSLFATFEHPPKSWASALILVVALACAMASALSGDMVLSFAPLAVSVCAMLALSIRHWRRTARLPLQAILAPICLLVAAASGAGGDAAGRTGLALFSAAGILGIALALVRRSHGPVAQEGGQDLRVSPVGRGR